MPLSTSALIRPVLDGAAALGVFERLHGYEPKAAPGAGLTLAVWVQRMFPTQTSVLDATTLALVMNARVYLPMLHEPQEDIDPIVTDAAGAVMGFIHTDLDLGGTARCVDVLGAEGVRLEAQAGYLEHDRQLYRVMTVTIPVLVDNVWSQQP